MYDLSGKIFAIFGPGCTAGCWTAGAMYPNPSDPASGVEWRFVSARKPTRETFLESLDAGGVADQQ